LYTHDDTYRLERPGAKADLTTTESYRRWHTRFQTSEYLRTCLTAPL
jgi:hypothetical protein